MKILNTFAPVSDVDHAIREFHARHGITTRVEVRRGPRSVSWRVLADLERTGKLPDVIVAGGVTDTRGRADRQIAKRFRYWTVMGPAGMAARASW